MRVRGRASAPTLLPVLYCRRNSLAYKSSLAMAKSLARLLTHPFALPENLLFPSPTTRSTDSDRHMWTPLSTSSILLVLFLEVSLHASSLAAAIVGIASCLGRILEPETHQDIETAQASLSRKRAAGRILKSEEGRYVSGRWEAATGHLIGWTVTCARRTAEIPPLLLCQQLRSLWPHRRWRHHACAGTMGRRADEREGGCLA